jgi:aerobic-type carbon monoxide dehydrogenase small subunit (CoxS/CutS family)
VPVAGRAVSETTVTTIEALGDREMVHPLQQSSVDDDGLQKPFDRRPLVDRRADCEAGFITSVVNQLKRRSDAAEGRI